MLFKILLSGLTFDKYIIKHPNRQRKAGESQGLSNRTKYNKSHVTMEISHNANRNRYC